MRRMGLTQAGLGIDRRNPPRMHQPRHACVMHCLSLPPSPGSHPTDALVWRVRVGLLQSTHQRELFCTLPLRVIVRSGPWQSAQDALPGNAELRMRRLNQRPRALRWHGQLVFQPVQRHLALPDLLVSLRLACLLVTLPLGTAYREKVGQLLVEAMLPRRHWRWRHSRGPGELMDGFEPFERFERHTGFALGALLFPLCRHLPSPPL
jgi:hypothetical protein